jgi:hypothetical protein
VWLPDFAVCIIGGCYCIPSPKGEGFTDPKKGTLKRLRNFIRGRVVGLSQESSVQKDGKQVVETAVQARGGLLGRPVLLVLIVSCVLAVAALIVTYSGA